MHTNRQPSSSGFTLLELLLVLTISGLAVVLVPPLFSGLLPTLTLRSEAWEVAQVLSQLRSQAITTGKQTRIYFFPHQRRYRLDRLAGDVTLSEKTVINVDGEKFSMDKGDGALIRFYPDGSSSGGSVRLANAKRAYRVDVNWLTGLPSIAEDKSR